MTYQTIEITFGDAKNKYSNEAIKWRAKLLFDCFSALSKMILTNNLDNNKRTVVQVGGPRTHDSWFHLGAVKMIIQWRRGSDSPELGQKWRLGPYQRWLPNTFCNSLMPKSKFRAGLIVHYYCHKKATSHHMSGVLQWSLGIDMGHIVTPTQLSLYR